MRRFFVEDLGKDAGRASIRGDELRHLRVLRLKKGDAVALFDGSGLVRSGVIVSVGSSEAAIDLEPGVLPGGESGLHITLISGLIKGQKPDLVVQKATELGVKSIVFYHAGRSVPAPGGPAAEKRLERWRRIALGAVKQCGRSLIPGLAMEKGLRGAIARGQDAGLRLFFDERGGRPLDKVLGAAEKGCAEGRSVVLLIGPEGGFTEEERAMVIKEGFTACTLGPRVLRAETAAITAAALLQHRLGDI